MREPQQLKEDIELAMGASQEAFEAANASAAESSEPVTLPEVRVKYGSETVTHHNQEYVWLYNVSVSKFMVDLRFL